MSFEFPIIDILIFDETEDILTDSTATGITAVEVLQDASRLSGVEIYIADWNLLVE